MDGKFEEIQSQATVATSEAGVEESVLSRDRWEELRRARGEGRSVSRLARDFDLDRKTVRRALAQTEWQPYQRDCVAQTLLTAHASWLAARAPQVHYSARILFQELTLERGYQGSYDTVRNAVRPLRAEAAVASLTQRRFETEAGEQSQVDWGQARVRFGDETVCVHVFVLTLGFSRRAWAEGYLHERMESLLGAHEHAFEHFGGHTVEVLYDRMRTVVHGAIEGKPRWNATFEAFAAHWGFTPRLCRPYRAKTKGKVESGVKYVKRNFLPGRSFRDLDDFNAQLSAWLADVSDVRVHGTTHERPIDRFAREAPALVRTTDQPSFFQAMRKSRVVAEDWLVAVDANRYSVPWRLIGKTVDVVRVGDRWQISHQGRVVAEHVILHGRHQISVDPAHGPGAVTRNARTRFAAPTATAAIVRSHEIEVRDLSVYEQILEVA